MTCLQGHYLDFTSSRVIKTFELFFDLVMQFSISFFFFFLSYSKDPERRCASSLVYLLLEH